MQSLSDKTFLPADRRFDGAAVVVVFIFVLIAIPSQLVIGPLGGAGTPAQVIGMAAFLWWVWDRVHRPADGLSAVRPVRTAALIWGASVLLAFAAAMIRPISSAELSTANLGLLSVLAWLGILLVASDGIPSLPRLSAVVSWLTVGGAAIATLGILQFITHQPFTDYIQIPGLTLNQQLYGALTRDGFVRPSGTAVHPIEFGAVLTMILPFAIYRVIDGRHPNIVGRWFPVVTISVAISISISRSAFVCAAVAVIAIIPTIPRAERRALLAGIAFLATMVFLLVPGMVGTITGLFTSISDDPSAQSRTGSYGIAAQFIQQSPLVGRGMFTFLPSYRIFDNQYLLFLVEIGFVGFLATVALLLTGITSAVRASLRVLDLHTRYLALSIAISLIVATIGLALFDAFSFPMVPGLLFLVLGLSGAAARLVPAK